MGSSTNQPFQEKSHTCMKHNITIPLGHIDCRDPKTYCKFRTSCLIWFLHKESFKAGTDAEHNEFGYTKGSFPENEQRI